MCLILSELKRSWALVQELPSPGILCLGSLGLDRSPRIRPHHPDYRFTELLQKELGKELGVEKSEF